MDGNDRIGERRGPRRSPAERAGRAGRKRQRATEALTQRGEASGSQGLTRRKRPDAFGPGGLSVRWGRVGRPGARATSRRPLPATPAPPARIRLSPGGPVLLFPRPHDRVGPSVKSWAADPDRQSGQPWRGVGESRRQDGGVSVDHGSRTPRPRFHAAGRSADG